jgi:hypothetical protein
MFCCLLLEELIVPSFGNDFHRVILGYGPVEPMSKSFAYGRVP